MVLKAYIDSRLMIQPHRRHLMSSKFKLSPQSIGVITGTVADVNYKVRKQKGKIDPMV